MFKHKLGNRVTTRVTEFIGIITARSENLYGCNRYYIQPKADIAMKVPDGWWVDEDDIIIIDAGVEVIPKDTGGQMSKIC